MNRNWPLAMESSNRVRVAGCGFGNKASYPAIPRYYSGMANNARQSLMTPDQHRRMAKLLRDEPHLDPNSAVLTEYHEKIAPALERRFAPINEREP